MAVTRKEEERALNAEERDVVNLSRHPDVQDVADAELVALQERLRHLRDKARTLANQKRREIRGKSAPRGSTPVTSDQGSSLKLAVISMALKRVNAEVQRRDDFSRSHSLVENAQKALMMKQQSEKNKTPFNTRHANLGIRDIPDTKVVSLINPMERGRQKKAAGVAQARRDNHNG